MRPCWMLLWCIALHAQSAGVYTVDLVPESGETFAGPCRFELTIPAAELATRAVIVIYDRGNETRQLYNDPALFEYAEKHRLALLWARHCPAAESGDIDSDPARGLGRALMTALDRLTHPSQHGELSSAKVIVLGFDEAGALAARMPQFAPDRVLAAIVYAPTGLPGAAHAPVSARIPQLVAANGADATAGTHAASEYFQKNFLNGAPWTFVIQNGASHDGALSNLKPIFFSWLESVLEAAPDTTAPVAMSALQRSGWWLFVRLEGTQVRDESGSVVSMVRDAKTQKVGQGSPSGYVSAGWVPSKKAANDWQSFMKRGR